MLTCLINGVTKNLIDDPYDKETWKKWAAKNIVTCPVCSKPYEYCHGRIIPPYFRHKDKAECEDKYAEPETAEHIKGKQDLYQWLKTVPGVTDLDLEHWIEGTHQRPDLYFLYNGKPTVVEYQCSPISTEYHERHELYQAGGINDIWICGVKKYLQACHDGVGKKRLNEVEKIYGFYYDPTNEVLYYVDHNMPEKDFLHTEKKIWNAYEMDDLDDYADGKENFFQVKTEGVSYYKEYYYPSGRRSNKYPYPLTKEIYQGNYSVAHGIKLREVLNGRNKCTAV